MIKVLFVCLGNICRSPMAEGLFIQEVKNAGLADKIMVDSCGTSSWHVGERPDGRMQETADKYNVELPSRSRQMQRTDFVEFDYILPMDRSNLRDVNQMKDQVSEAKAQVFLMRYFDDKAPEANVPDPYYRGSAGFEEVYEILLRSSKNLLEHIKKEKGLG